MEGRERVVEVGERGLEASDIELRRYEVALQVRGLARSDGGVELDQRLAGLDGLPVDDPDRAHHTGLERLDDLAVAGRNDLAGGGRHDVDFAEGGPDRRRRKQSHQGGADGAADRGGRGLDDLQRCRQEGELVAVSARSAREGDYLFVWLHAVMLLQSAVRLR